MSRKIGSKSGVQEYNIAGPVPVLFPQNREIELNKMVVLLISGNFTRKRQDF